MVDFVVGARFEAKTNTLVSAANESREALEKLKAAGAGGRIETDVIVKDGGRKAIATGAWDSAAQPAPATPI